MYLNVYGISRITMSWESFIHLPTIRNTLYCPLSNDEAVTFCMCDQLLTTICDTKRKQTINHKIIFSTSLFGHKFVRNSLLTMSLHYVLLFMLKIRVKSNHVILQKSNWTPKVLEDIDVT